MERFFKASQRAQTLYELLIRREDMPSGTLEPPGLMAMRFVPSIKNQKFDEISISTPLITTTIMKLHCLRTMILYDTAKKQW